MEKNIKNQTFKGRDEFLSTISKGVSKWTNLRILNGMKEITQRISGNQALAGKTDYIFRPAERHTVADLADGEYVMLVEEVESQRRIGQFVEMNGNVQRYYWYGEIVLTFKDGKLVDFDAVSALKIYL